MAEADLRTRLTEKRPFTVSNTVTLYDAGGRTLFERKGVEYVCVQVAETGDAVACVTTRFQHWEGPPDPSEAKPDADTVFVLGRDGEVRARYIERENAVREDRLALSPNGRWLAYAVTTRESGWEPHHVALHDLATETTIEVPALGRDPRIGRFGWVSDEGDLLDPRPGEEAARRHQDSGVVELEVVWRRPR
jgi:hypothetical protein